MLPLGETEWKAHETSILQFSVDLYLFQNKNWKYNRKTFGGILVSSGTKYNLLNYHSKSRDNKWSDRWIQYYKKNAWL